MRWWWQKPKWTDPREFLAEVAKLLEVEFQPLVFPGIWCGGSEHGIVYETKPGGLRRVVTYYPPCHMPSVTFPDLSRARDQFFGVLKANPEQQFQFVLVAGSKIFPFYPDMTLGGIVPYSIAGSITEPVDVFWYLKNLPVKECPRSAS